MSCTQVRSLPELKSVQTNRQEEDFNPFSPESLYLDVNDAKNMAAAAGRDTSFHNLRPASPLIDVDGDDDECEAAAGAADELDLDLELERLKSDLSVTRIRIKKPVMLEEPPPYIDFRLDRAVGNSSAFTAATSGYQFNNAGNCGSLQVNCSPSSTLLDTKMTFGKDLQLCSIHNQSSAFFVSSLPSGNQHQVCNAAAAAPPSSGNGFLGAALFDFPDFEQMDLFEEGMPRLQELNKIKIKPVRYRMRKATTMDGGSNPWTFINTSKDLGRKKAIISATSTTSWINKQTTSSSSPQGNSKLLSSMKGFGINPSKKRTSSTFREESAINGLLRHSSPPSTSRSSSSPPAADSAAPPEVEYDPLIHCGVVDFATTSEPCLKSLSCCKKGHTLNNKRQVKRPRDFDDLKRAQKEARGAGVVREKRQVKKGHGKRKYIYDKYCSID